MAEYKFTAALNASTFPLITRYQGRAVMIGQLDAHLRNPISNNTTNQFNNPQEQPQVLYCENVIPTIEGCKSVGYTVGAQPAFPGAGTADDIFLLRTSTSSVVSYLCPAAGKNYIINTNLIGFPWVANTAVAGVNSSNYVTTATVNGDTYVCYSGLKLLKWDGTNLVDCAGTIVGIVASTIRAIGTSNNYLIVIYADNSIKWSSLTNPLDFTISAATGAGSQIPIDMLGTPIYVSSVPGGFLIHCYENVVAAFYTQNAAQPWTFRGVKGSGGFAISAANFNNIARKDNSGTVYGLSNYGVQSLSLREAETVYPEVQDFINGRVLETFDSTTNLLSITRVANIYTKINLLFSRYLFISYGSDASGNLFDYALVFDLFLRRWGKIKNTHVDIFYRPLVAGASEAILFLKANGSADIMELADTVIADAGVLILGKYQISRTSQIGCSEVELEVLDSNEAPTLLVATSYNGTTLGQLDTMTLYSTSDNYRKYQKQIEGENIAFILKGSFSLAAFVITATKGGRM
jgi:hypothetical protein